MNKIGNSLKLHKKCLETARRQFCLDVGLPWEEYQKKQNEKVWILKSVYAPETMDVAVEGARNYGERTSFFRAIICLGQLFICCDERIYDWVTKQYADSKPEWFCDYKNLRKLDEKLKEYGQEIYDTHIYFLPEEEGTIHAPINEDDSTQKLVWYEQEEILRFQEKNRFASAISFWEGQPDVLAVAAMREDYFAEVKSCKEQKDIKLAAAESKECKYEEGYFKEKVQGVDPESGKDFDQSHMCGMAGASRDGEYLWQIGINVDKDYAGQGLGHKLVRALKEEILRRGKVPFYGTSESHTLSQTVGLKAGFVPAWTEVSARKEQ